MYINYGEQVFVTTAVCHVPLYGHYVPVFCNFNLTGGAFGRMEVGNFDPFGSSDLFKVAK